MLRPRRRHALLTLCVGFLFANVATACGSSLKVQPGGADRGDCVEAACGSFRYAYDQSRDGDVVEVAAGTYGSQRVPRGEKRVTFRGERGATLRQLHNFASNITYDGIDIDADGRTPTGAALELHGEGRNVTFKNGRVGNVLNEKGAMIAGTGSTASTNLVIDNVDFHDVYNTGGDVHNECIMAHAPGMTIRNSTFTNCAVMDISLGRGDWWGQPPYGNVTLENNVFGHSTHDTGADSWHYFGLAWFVGRFENARVVNNTFENLVRMEDQHIGPGPYSGVWANNIGGGWQCLPGVTYRGNVGKRCSRSDKAVNPSSSCGPPACPSLRTMPVGWIDPARRDFRLRPGSPAVDAGSAEFATRRDMDGVERDARPDAGAYELTDRSPAAAPSAGPRLRSVRLRPATICRRARRGCPAAARLRVRVSRPARLRVRLARSRGGRVRTVVSPRRRRHARPLRARGLARGRYRVRVVAVDTAGRRSGVAVRRLRVR